MRPTIILPLLTLLSTLPLALTTSSSKRGLVYVPSKKHPTDDNIWDSPSSDLTWYYNYGYEPSSSFTSSSLEFVPMLWGATDGQEGTPFLDSVTSQIKSGANITYVLAFNEPDGEASTGGSNVPADLAAATWIKQIEPLRKLGVKLGAPAVTGAPSGFTWLQDFFTACAGGCTPDFVPVHWYGNFEGLASHVGQVMGTYPNMTVWITEYGLPNSDLATTQTFYNQTSSYFDR
ncbi:glycoside hydrolase family 128 protein, partial [Lepidopterella palustris CBS 459.81]